MNPINDLIIIGGGPSGSAAGITAGKMGLRTIIFEKSIFPRNKPCGGALSEQAMSYLDFKIPPEIIEREIFGARIHYKNKQLERKKKYRIAVNVSRDIFDDFLLKKAKEAGTKIHMNQEVDDFKQNSEFVEVFVDNTSFKTKYLLICEGAHGSLKYKIRNRDKKNEFGICYVTDVPEKNKIINEFIFNAIDIHFGVTKFGYGWIFPHEKYYSVGIGGIAKYLKNPKDIMKNFLVKNGFSPNHDLKAHLIPTGGIKRRISNGRVILCGDAAGFVDSFYGEGIAYAIRSGQIAVESISEAIQGSRNLDIHSRYKKRCDDEFISNLQNSLRFSKMIHHFPGLFFRIFLNKKEVLDKFLEVPAQKCSYKEFHKWLISKLPKLLV